MNKEKTNNNKNENKTEDKNEKKKFGLKDICAFLILTMITVSFGFLVGITASKISQDILNEHVAEENTTNDNGFEENQVLTESTETQEPTVTCVSSEYDFKVDEITVEIEGLSKGYDIAFINDLHLITDTEPGDVLEENLPTVTERYNSFSVTPEGIHADELWPEVIKFLNHYNFDAVVFGGDMLDYCSHKNMEVLSEGFEELNYSKDQIIYIRSDHDYGGWYGGGEFTDTDGFILQSELLDGDVGENCIEFDEFLIVGMNKSYQNLSDDRFDFLMEKLNAGKPVIMVTHVPFYSEEDASLEELSLEVRNKIYYWNKENSTYSPDAKTQEFIDCMYDEDSNVVQILAAHMHAAWDGVVANGLKEHIFAPTFEGRIGIVHVVAAKEGEQK